LFAKISKGNGLRGALEYDFAPAKNGEARAEFICGSLFGTPKQMARQAAPLRALRQVANPIWRVALAADPKDGVLSAAQWEAIALDFLKGMGLSDPSQAAWCCVRHSDRDHDHLHLSVVRVLKDGTLFSIQNDAFKAKKVTAELEKKYQLATHSRERAERRAPSISTISAKKRTGKMSSKEQIQSFVDEILADADGEIQFEELQKRLAEKGIDLKDSVTQKGRLQGFSYMDKATGVAVSGSKLGADYSLGLLTRGVKYSPQNAPKADEREVPAEPKKSIPPAQYPAEQITQSTQVSGWKFDTNVGKNLIESGAMSSPFAIVCVAVAELALKLARLGVELFRAIWAWLSKKLGLAGLGGAANEATRSFQIAPRSEIIDVPSRVVPDNLLISQTAKEINAVAEAVAQNDSNLLPESAKNLAEYFEKQDSAEQLEADPFQFFGDEEALEALHAPTPAKPKPLGRVLKEAAEAHHIAAQALAKARAAAAEDDGLWDGVPEASKAEDQAHGALLKVQSDSKQWLTSSFGNRAAAALGGNPYTADIKAAEALLSRRRAELATAQRDEASKPKRPAFAAPELILAEQKAAENLNAARAALMNLARKNIAFIRQNPMQTQAAVEMEAAIKRGIGGYVFGRDNSLLESKIAQLKAFVEAERLRQNPAPYDAEAEEEMQKLRAETEAAPK
jgi:Relaxase/Mobilisation nuclease domain